MKNITTRWSPLATMIAAIGLGASLPAQAFKFEMENGITGTFDSTISFGVQMRLQSPDRSIISNDSGGNVATTGTLGERVNGPGGGIASVPDFNYAHTDDGDLNYKKGRVFSAVLKGTHELFLKEQGNWSALGRFTWSSDFLADDTRRTPLHPDAKDAMEKNFSLLDLWVSKEFSLGGENGAKEAGKVRLEGRDYIMADGDVVLFKFSN
jgi:hypothetical protein